MTSSKFLNTVAASHTTLEYAVNNLDRKKALIELNKGGGMSISWDGSISVYGTAAQGFKLTQGYNVEGV